MGLGLGDGTTGTALGLASMRRVKERKWHYERGMGVRGGGKDTCGPTSSEKQPIEKGIPTSALELLH